jgi:hypothetical protein
LFPYILPSVSTITMNTNTALIMFAVIAAFGLVTAMLVVPIVPQAHAQGRAPECPPQSPSGGGNPSIAHGCGPIR